MSRISFQHWPSMSATGCTMMETATSATNYLTVKSAGVTCKKCHLKEAVHKLHMTSGIFYTEDKFPFANG